MSIQVLDRGYVQLIEYWGSDERIIEAARMSTGKGFEGWGRSHDEDCPLREHTIKTQCPECEAAPGDEKLLAYLYNNKHSTPFEMAGMVIEVKAPIFVFREWHRHRTQSYNEMSARYIPLPDENYLPDIENLLNRSMQATTTTNRQASGGGILLSRDAALRDLYDLATYYEVGQGLYQRLLANGWPKELARLPVPVARYSRMRASANLRNWLAFLTLRQAPQAQWEIREYANAVGECIAVHFPRTWGLYAAGR